MSEARILPLSADSIALAAELIRQGELVVMPTDTVYGITCNPFDEQAIAKLFAAKHRAPEKSIQILLGSIESIGSLRLELPKPLDVLSGRFLPGAFSPICNVCEGCELKTVNVDTDTQAIRVPAGNNMQEILSKTGVVASSSANLSGNPSPQTAQEAANDLGDRVSLYIDAGPTPGPLPSTVVAADSSQPYGITILREGAISREEIVAVLAALESSGC
jgi:tRNA threonylcarbamoyl adenosine modification protein (Sua5/YciO/YrdC/YwlC family)